MDVADPVPPSPNPNEIHPQPDTKPVIPLRQRQLPASFWQEPTSTRDPNHHHPLVNFSQNNQILPLDPWFNSTPMLPNYLTQRLATAVPNGYPHPGSFGPSMWARNQISCNCSACLNYCMAFRVPEVYGLRYNPVLGGTACCPALNCVDQSCKLCASTAERWHPDRLRQVRLRSARYNAIVD